MDLYSATPDLTACDREPIHLLGSIQPHGVLIAITGPRAEITHASLNADVLLGMDVADAIGRPLAELLPELAARAAGAAARLQPGAAASYLGTQILGGPSGRPFDIVGHRSGDLLVLELEEAVGSAEDLAQLYPSLRGFVERLQGALLGEELCQLIASEVRQLTGFDRALVYRFDEAWNGTVLAEERNEELPSYLDLRFPASDIPAQARELYRRNRIRIIPDAGYVPVPIADGSDGAGQPIDLSQSVLRSVSPVHVEYMRNMGTAASMSVSIIADGRLWGLVSCHNRLPRQVPLQQRNGCDLLTQIFSMQLEARERAGQADRRMRLGAVQSRLLGFMAEEPRFLEGLLKHPSALMELVAADGAAVASGEEVWTFGATPSPAETRRLVDWLRSEHREPIFVTDSLREVFPGSEAWVERASGLLAIAISEVHAHYVLWFRPEIVQTVKWGGDPRKPMQEEAGSLRLHPRKSFETWKETVRGRSAPWRSEEVEAAKELRNAIVGIVLRRAEELAAMSEELQRSNKELEAFSYSVSHDLRAPFRHIVGYAELLRSKEGESLSERGQRYVTTIIESAYSAGQLVDSLLSFSQMGRSTLNLLNVDLDAMVADVRRRMAAELQDRRIRWQVGQLGTVRADPMMLRLVFENLLSNAVKYTRRRDEAVIDVGSREENGETIYYVRDNGVGFDMAYVGKLFGVFQRLHRMEEFEGTGIGLANVRRIVERHGGRVWAEGELDRGATFYFTLPRV